MSKETNTSVKDLEALQAVPRIDFNRVPMFIGAQLTSMDLAILYPKLAEPMDLSNVDKTLATQTRKGYDTTNWPYQLYVNRLNEVVGPSHWRIIEGVTYEAQRGETWDVVITATLEFGNWVEGNWVPIAQRSNFGNHSSRHKGDALKGALTNALKKTVAMAGPGNQAYAGELDDDLKDLEGNPQGHKGSARVNSGGRTAAQGRQGALPQQKAAQSTQPASAQGEGNSPEILSGEAEVKTQPMRGKNSENHDYAMVEGVLNGSTVRIVGMGEQLSLVGGVKPGDILKGEFRLIKRDPKASIWALTNPA